VDVLEIRLEDSALVGLSDLQQEASATILFVVVAVGPGNDGAEKVVLYGLVGVEAENDVVRLPPGDKVGEIGIFESRQGIKVKRNFLIKLIFLHALVVFGDFEELVHMKTILDPSPPFLHDINQPRLEKKHPNHHEKTNNYESEKNQVSQNHGVCLVKWGFIILFFPYKRSMDGKGILKGVFMFLGGEKIISVGERQLRKRFDREKVKGEEKGKVSRKKTCA
jgi:hypothetical protein